MDGRKRTYRLTGKGRAVFQEELDRLRACLNDAEEDLTRRKRRMMQKGAQRCLNSIHRMGSF